MSASTATWRRIDWQSWVALVALVAALAWPLVSFGGEQEYLLGGGSGALLSAVLITVAVLASLAGTPTPVGNFIILCGIAIAVAIATLTLGQVATIAQETGQSAATFFTATAGFWALVLLAWALAWLIVTRLSAARAHRPFGELLLRILIPALFGASLLFLWEVLVRGLNVPFVILPPPSAIWAKLATSVPTLWADFRQTFLKAVIAGYTIGCLSGFVVAIAADRVAFLKRGLLPVGNLVSALPIVGIAPIMVMWFGFDWPSKAAVVVAMTFFPMLVNTLAGLETADATQRDLMRTYAADYRQELGMLRLPAALPFIFNALKINSTLAMIGAIVAEFFGTPIVGMGFRISTEVGRMNTDMVWAEIAVAAVAGTAFYGVVSLIERAITFWHPSFRQP